MLDHFRILVHTRAFSNFSRHRSPERAKSPDLRDERAPPDGGPIVRTLPVLGERTEYVRFAGGSTLGRCVQHTRGYAEVGLEHRLEHRHAASEGSSGLWRVGVNNCGALEHRCERTTSSGSADTMATMLDHFWTHTHIQCCHSLSREHRQPLQMVLPSVRAHSTGRQSLYVYTTDPGRGHGVRKVCSWVHLNPLRSSHERSGQSWHAGRRLTTSRRQWRTIAAAP